MTELENSHRLYGGEGEYPSREPASRSHFFGEHTQTNKQSEILPHLLRAGDLKQLKCLQMTRRVAHSIFKIRDSKKCFVFLMLKKVVTAQFIEQEKRGKECT